MINSLEEARKEINRIDEEMAKLFEGRMECAEVIAEYKKENNLPIFDKKREEELVERNSRYIENQGLREYYKDFLLDVMSISKKYQKEIIHHCDSLKVADGATVLPISLGERSYDIHIEKGSISKMAEIFGIKEKRAFVFGF